MEIDKRNCVVRCVGYNAEDGCFGYADNKIKFKIGKIYEIKHNTLTSEIGHTYDLNNTNKNVFDFLSKWYKFEIINLTPKTKIIITTDGKTTTAKLYEDKKIIRSSEAKCSPNDKFNFMVGAKLAMDRLEKKIEYESYYNGKVVCIQSSFAWWTKGKIYEVKNGVIYDDDGNRFPKGMDGYKNVKDIAVPFVDFIPLVE